jgi:hypothetical protein
MSEVDGFIVLELPRGESDVVRVTRKMYEGRPFTDVRVFFRGSDGAMHPTKKGCSVRDHELADVVDALQRIAAKVGPLTPREQRRNPVRRELVATGEPAGRDRTADMEAF